MWYTGDHNTLGLFVRLDSDLERRCQMATNARTWFYQTPEKNPYLLQERVNGTLWMARLWDVYFVTERAEPPFRMSAVYHGTPLMIEWEPGKWFRLTAPQSLPGVITAFSNILQLPASLMYTDNHGMVVTEWHRDGGHERWREIQGNPMYQSVVRLNP